MEPENLEASGYTGVLLGKQLKAHVRRIAKQETRSMGAVIRILLQEAIKARQSKSR